MPPPPPNQSGPSEYKAPPNQPGPSQEVLNLGNRCEDLLAGGLERHLLAGRLGVTRKRVNYALATVRRVKAEADAVAAGEPAPRKHRAVHNRPSSEGLPTDWSWQDAAACKGQPTGLFFPPEGERAAERHVRELEASAFCGWCPVHAECLDHSFGGTNPARWEQYGLWAGVNEDARAKRRRKRMRAASAALAREGAQEGLSEEEAVA